MAKNAKNAGGTPIVPAYEPARQGFTSGTAMPGYIPGTDAVIWFDPVTVPVPDPWRSWRDQLERACERSLTELKVPKACWDGVAITAGNIEGILAAGVDGLRFLKFPFDGASKPLFDAWRTTVAGPHHGRADQGGRGAAEIEQANWSITTRWLIRATRKSKDIEQQIALGRLIGFCESNLAFGRRSKKVAGGRVTAGRSPGVDFERRDAFVRSEIRRLSSPRGQSILSRVFADLEASPDFQRQVRSFGGDAITWRNIKKIWSKRDTIS